MLQVKVSEHLYGIAYFHSGLIFVDNWFFFLLYRGQIFQEFINTAEVLYFYKFSPLLVRNVLEL